MIRRILILLIAIFGLILWSCKTEHSFNLAELKEKIIQLGEDDTISQSEWNELVNKISLNHSERSLNRFFTNDSLDEKKLSSYIEELSFDIEKTEAIPSAKSVNIYIENSGSMLGFMNGSTGLKNTLTKLIIELKSDFKDKNINFHFINKRVTSLKTKGNKENYPSTLSKNIDDKDSKGDSDINHIFKQILDSTSDNSISILFSDCAYSVGKNIKNNDVDGALKIQKSLTEGAFKEAIKHQNFSTLFIQLTSDFHGAYYTKNNQKIILKGEEIPYYITVIGRQKELSKFDFIDKLDGFKHKLAFTTQDYSKKCFYSIVQTNEDHGSYRPDREKNVQPHIIRSISEINVPKRGKTLSSFVFSLAVDFSKLPIEYSYPVQKGNYFIETGDYDILKIIPYNKSILKPSSLVKLEKNQVKPTHIILFKSKSEKYNDLIFSLKKNIPEWIYQRNTNDDSNIKTNPNQTFGLKYLAEGIFEAYQNTSVNKDYITFTINIKK